MRYAVESARDRRKRFSWPELTVGDPVLVGEFPDTRVEFEIEAEWLPRSLWSHPVWRVADDGEAYANDDFLHTLDVSLLEVQPRS